MQTEEERDLERIMDSLGMAELLAAIARIATEKQDHVASNWQDRALAKRWGAIAAQLEKLARNVDDPYA